MKELGLALLAAVLALVGQAITTFILQKKREDQKTEENVILEAVEFLGNAIHQLNYYAHEKDEEKFKEVFKRGDHFTKLTVIRFHLKRIRDKVILNNFKEAYDAFSQLGCYVDTHKNIFDGSGNFQEHSDKFSKAQDAFESYCANYLKFGKISKGKF